MANLHTNHVNRGEDPAKALDELPVEAIAYVHVAGGVEKDGVWHDTHAHPVTAPVLDVLAELRSRVDPPGVLLERDDAFPPGAELAAELETIRGTLRSAARAGTVARAAVPPSSPAAPAAAAPASSSALPTRSAPSAPSGNERDTEPLGAPRPGARDRTAVAQTALLSALVAGTPAPEGFDHRRLRVQSRALAAKRADVVAKVAPELPEILGDGYRPAFLSYARSRPMNGGYRRDAMEFVERILVSGGLPDPVAQRRLTHWWEDRSGPRPPGRTTRLVRAARAVLVGK